MEDHVLKLQEGRTAAGIAEMLALADITRYSTPLLSYRCHRTIGFSFSKLRPAGVFSRTRPAEGGGSDSAPRPVLLPSEGSQKDGKKTANESWGIPEQFNSSGVQVNEFPPLGLVSVGLVSFGLVHLV